MPSKRNVKNAKVGSGRSSACQVNYNVDIVSFGPISRLISPHFSAMVLRRDKYEKHVKIYWVETKIGGRKLLLNCMLEHVCVVQFR